MPQMSDESALRMIHAMLSEMPWNEKTCDLIANVLGANGRHVERKERP